MFSDPVMGGRQWILQKFDAAGPAVTYDSCSFAPDPAFTAASIATGYKTYSHTGLPVEVFAGGTGAENFNG